MLMCNKIKICNVAEYRSKRYDETRSKIYYVELYAWALNKFLSLIITVDKETWIVYMYKVFDLNDKENG